jgi:hypothetical protein
MRERSRGVATLANPGDMKRPVLVATFAAVISFTLDGHQVIGIAAGRAVFLFEL